MIRAVNNPGSEWAWGEPYRRRAKILAVIWVGVVYATIPLVRTFQRWFLARWDKGWVTVFVLVAMAIMGLAVIRFVLRFSIRPTAVDVVWLVAVGGFSAWWAWQLRAIPEEAVHLLEYAVMAVLFYLALRPSRTNFAVMVSAVLLGTIMGTVDELIQWITPRRFWEYRDVGLNSGACVLAMIAVWRLDPGPWSRATRRDIRFTLRVAAVLIVLLMLTLANTPPRAAWYSARVPLLGFLSHPANEMAEYGHLHVVPGLGEFKSRLNIHQLIDEDQRRFDDVSTILDRYPRGRYWAFLRNHQGYEDPLLYEARVHIFSRDVHLRRARKASPGSREEMWQATQAFRENEILEQYFGNTLRQSAYKLSAAEKRELEDRFDPDRHFVSKNASHLITWIGESGLRTLLLVIVGLLVAADITIGVRGRREEERVT
jgi:hypothetical protein